MKKILLAGAAALLVASNAFADEAKIRRVVEAALGGVQVEYVRQSPVPGFYEVHFQSRGGPQIIYTDAEANYIIQGNIYDTRSRENITEERLNKLSAIRFESLPLDLAVKVRRGNGKRVLAMFSDPHCPACRQFEQTLAQLDDITIYYFMYPVIRPELVDHSKAVWCAPDRAKAWLALAARAKPQVPDGKTDCDTPIERVLELGRSLGVNSTPTLFFATGERVRGGLQVADLRAKLDDAARSAPTAR
ncbi:MAG: DsbC family protein [Burkholderiales bacterium]